MEKILLEFDGITCSGCVTAVNEKLESFEKSHLKSINKTTGNSILESTLTKSDLQNRLMSFQGCCSSCQISLRSLQPLKGQNDQVSLSSTDDDSYYLIKKQYKQALEQIITNVEVACSEYCVCKTTSVNRFEEFSAAPSLSSIFNLVEYFQKYEYLYPGMSVVDFGSGTGHDAFQIAPLIAPGKVTGIDITPEMVDFAKSTADKLNISNVIFHAAGDFNTIVPASQDLIFTNNVFNFLMNQSEFLLQAQTILKPEGYLIIADEYTIDDLPDSIRNDPAFQCGGIADAQSMDQVILLCQKIGFKVQREKSLRTYEITYNTQQYRLKSGLLVFQNIP